MGKIEKTLITILIAVGILGTSFMIGMGIKENIEKNDDESKSYTDDYESEVKTKTLRR